jgi:hypothetical protein
MAGAVRIDEIEAILEAVPDEDLPYSKSYLIDQVLAVLLTPDYDTDGDGVDDAVTVGLHIGAVGAEILGVAEACTDDADCDDGKPVHRRRLQRVRRVQPRRQHRPLRQPAPRQHRRLVRGRRV